MDLLLGLVFLIFAVPTFLYVGYILRWGDLSQMRGAVLSDAGLYKKSLATEGNSSNIMLGDIPLPAGTEKAHSIIVASTGAGKSVALRKLLRQLRSLGDRVICIDNGREFSKSLADQNDLIMDPLETGWDLRNEISSPYEWANIARSVVPDGNGNAAEWRKMAQNLLSDVGVSVGSECDNRKLYDILTVMPVSGLQPILEGTASSVMLQEGGQKLLTNIRSVFAEFIKSWQFAKHGDFSFKKYMTDDSEKRWLWIPIDEARFELVRSTIATWIEVLVMAGLERSESSQRTWIIIDEFDSLGELSSMIAATTKLRKRNVCIVVACQSFSQLVTNYGDARSHTLLNCFSNLLALRCVDEKTAEAVSLRLGSQEFVQMSYTTNKDGTSSTSSVGNRRIVMASEIQNLADLAGYVKPAGNYPAVETRIAKDW
jgi:hypothetical protein